MRATKNPLQPLHPCQTTSRAVHPDLPKSLPLSKSENEPSDPKAIIKEFKEAMDKGDERAALRAEAKYRRIDIKAERTSTTTAPTTPTQP